MSKYSSNTEYKEDDNTQSDFHQEEQMETVIYTTPDICDQNKVTVNPKIKKNNAKRVNQESSKGTVTKNQKTKNQHPERDKTVIIQGDNMIKHVNGWEMAEKAKLCDIYIKSFSGAKARCLKDHAKPSFGQNPDYFVLHVGKNDLDSDRSPELIAKSIKLLP